MFTNSRVVWDSSTDSQPTRQNQSMTLMIDYRLSSENFSFYSSFLLQSLTNSSLQSDCLLPAVSTVICDCFVQPDTELLSPEISEIWVWGSGYEKNREQLRAQEISTEKNITAVDADIFTRALRSHVLIKD